VRANRRSVPSGNSGTEVVGAPQTPPVSGSKDKMVCLSAMYVRLRVVPQKIGIVQLLTPEPATLFVQIIEPCPFPEPSVVKLPTGWL